jgi:hypothetical protein|tara:strand:- start:3504 stop:3608 length:105 start_codon:yes stop_codon:yes gene_type:complete
MAKNIYHKEGNYTGKMLNEESIKVKNIEEVKQDV